MPPCAICEEQLLSLPTERASKPQLASSYTHAADDHGDNCARDSKSVSEDTGVEKASGERDQGNILGKSDNIVSDTRFELHHSTVPVDATFKEQAEPAEEFFGCQTFPERPGDLLAHDDQSLLDHCTTDVLGDAGGDEITTLELDSNVSNVLAQRRMVHASLSSYATRWLPCLYALSSALYLWAPAPFLRCPPRRHLPAPITYCLSGGLAILSTQKVQIGYSGAGWLAVIGFGGVVSAPRHLPYWFTFFCGITEFLKSYSL